MSLGTGPDIPSYDKEREKEVKLGDKVQEWWNDLDDNHKFELLEPYYPDKLHLMGMDEAWDGLSWEDRLDIYREENEYNEVMP